MSDGNNVEDAIKVRVTQDFDSTGYGNAEDINADRVKGHSIEELYSDFISITVPAASAVPNSEGLYYADVTVKGIDPTKAILGIQMAYDTSISPKRHQPLINGTIQRQEQIKYLFIALLNGRILSLLLVQQFKQRRESTNARQ